MKLQRDARKGRLMCVVALAGVSELSAATMPMQTMMSRTELADDQAPALGLVSGDGDVLRPADLFASMAGTSIGSETWVDLQPQASTASVTSVLRDAETPRLSETRCAMLLSTAAATSPRSLATDFNGIDDSETPMYAP
ncbi:MAG: hypothetical protein SF069_12225 [Phycisphaerae bacterium]|nr:hypothetical protein [Phycisphaerae bacterium]